MPPRPNRLPDRAIPGRIEELSSLELLTTIRTGAEGAVPAGSFGKVVHVHGEDEAHDVEFIEPLQALVTITRDQIEPIPGEARADYAADALLDRAR